MNFWVQYLLLTALLFALYLCIHCTYAFYWENLPSLFGFSESDDLPGHSIDTRPLSSRVQHVREELTDAKVPVKAAGYKRALMVESKRQQVAKLAFFQSPP